MREQRKSSTGAAIDHYGRQVLEVGPDADLKRTIQRGRTAYLGDEKDWDLQELLTCQEVLGQARYCFREGPPRQVTG